MPTKNKATVLLREGANKAYAIQLIQAAPFEPLYQVIIKPCPSIRSLEQNAKMWAVLTDISKQVKWFDQYWTKDDWKDLFTAALETAERREQRMCPGLEGGIVALGQRTSKMSIKKMSDVIEYAQAWGTKRGVKWSEKARGE